MQVVVSRYDEDISWTEGLNVIIYNKGDPLPNTIPLENIGREAHTFLHHIITNYDSLSEYTCFLQGNPFEHKKDVLKLIKNFKAGKYLAVSDVASYCDYNGFPWHPNLPIGKWYDRFFVNPRTKFLFHTGGQCIVSRNTIRIHSKSFYEMLIQQDHTIYPWIYERLWPIIFSNEETKSFS